MNVSSRAIDINQITLFRQIFMLYWGNPERYEHIALRITRHIDLVWLEDIGDFEALSRLANDAGISISDYIKTVLKKHLTTRKP